MCGDRVCVRWKPIRGSAAYRCARGLAEWVPLFATVSALRGATWRNSFRIQEDKTKPTG
jgi:hypothetical protein